LHRFVFERRAGAVALSALFFAVSAVLALKLRYLHDEGLFTFDNARALLREPAALAFFVKAKPALMLLYLAPAALGLPAFLVAHALVGAGAVFLTSEAARRLDLPSPNAAGLLLATSLSFTIAASNGYPNSDGAFFLALFLYFYFAERRLPAALVLGALPFARSELAAVTVIFLAWDLWVKRDARFALGALAFGAVYALAGALYHQNPAWLYSHFPDPQGMPEELKVHRPPSPSEAARSLQQALLRGSPLFCALGIVGLSRGDRRSYPVFASMAAIYVAMTLFQVLGVLGFDTSPRYYVAPLPLVALLAAWALAPRARSGEKERPAAAWIAAPGLAMACALQGAVGAVFAAVAALASALRLVFDQRRAAEGVLFVGALAVAGAQLANDADPERLQHARTHALVASLRTAGIYKGQPLFTDLYAARHDRDAGIGEARVLINQAIDWEIRFDSNPRNGQYGAIVRALEAEGVLFDPARHAPRRDAVYALRRRERTKAWRDAIEAAGPKSATFGEFVVYWWPDAP
jgi:hypothetical protein